MLYDDYLAYTKTYQAKFGNKTVVLMEVGSFFEFYAVENEKVKEGAPMTELCSILNIQSTKKNKSIPQCSRTNPLMAGFPSVTLKKFVDLLLAEQYTIVLVEQTTPPPNPKRGVTQIISPSTYIDNIHQADSRYMMVWYISTGVDRVIKNKPCFILSVVYGDISTGETFVIEPINGDEEILCNEASRILTTTSPKELVILSESVDLSELTQVIVSIAKRTSVCVHDRTSESMHNYQQIVYQTTILRKVFTTIGMITPIEYISMERHPMLCTAFVYLLQFIYEHNETMISHIQKPTWIRTNEQLRCTNTSLEQLNIIQKSGMESSLMKLLNTCDTSMGKRRFYQLLTVPTTSITEMTKRYDLIDRLLVNQLYLEIRPQLALLKDMERLYRRIVLQQLQPSELSLFLTSLQHIRIISDWCLTNHICDDDWTVDDHEILSQWIQQECNKWNMDEMNVQLSQLESNVYKHGIHKDIDSLCESIEKCHQQFRNEVSDANRHMGQEFLKLEQTADKVYVLTMTTKRWETYLASNKRFSAQSYSPTNKNIVRISFPNMERIQNDITVQTSELRSLVKSRFLADLDIYLHYTLFMQRIVYMISTLDIGVTSAKNAFQFRYQRPIVVPPINESSSFICAKQVRHPIIERVQSHLPYIANDVMIGKETNGILLHGINASGKSSYMKSIGVNLVMAQAGMFVAAEAWEFSPYLDLFTRIPGGDNLFKGHSTFVAEMVEVRSILTQSSSHSLVIGDELASGTESVSAISIVAAGIVTLAQKKASFLFATHLHEVAQLDIIKTISTIKVCHMSVHYDETRKTLLYDRIVKDGSGETLYGLEVCKSLDMPLDFLHLANTIRQSYLHIQPQLVQPTVSNYSTKVIVDVCTMCKKNKAMETHHIKEQHTADKNGFIGTFHKHVPHNLMSVCEECHDHIHHKKVIVDGYKMTSNGPVLQIQHKSEPKLEETPKEKLEPKLEETPKEKLEPKHEESHDKTEEKPKENDEKPVEETFEIVQHEISEKDRLRERVQLLRKQGHSVGAVAIITGLTVYKIKVLEKEKSK